jgi:hypothetical protein
MRDPVAFHPAEKHFVDERLAQDAIGAAFPVRKRLGHALGKVRNFLCRIRGTSEEVLVGLLDGILIRARPCRWLLRPKRQRQGRHCRENCQ